MGSERKVIEAHSWFPFERMTEGVLAPNNRGVEEGCGIDSIADKSQSVDGRKIDC